MEENSSNVVADLGSSFQVSASTNKNITTATIETQSEQTLSTSLSEPSIQAVDSLSLIENSQDNIPDGAPTNNNVNDRSDDHSISSVKSLGILPLAVIIFYSVSGGPFGCEAVVRASGPFYTLLGFLIIPLIWSCQEALITAELGVMYPEASGGVAWVQEAFGQRAGWMAGYLGWVAGATDNAIYPVLFLDYLLQVLVSKNVNGGDDGDDGGIASAVEVHPIMRFALLSFTSIFLGYINWLGLPIVGNMSLSICALSMSPFVVMVILGVFQIEPSRWFILPESIEDDTIDANFDHGTVAKGGIASLLTIGGVLWRPYLNGLFWNLNSFDSAASFSGDIQEPERTLPRALFWSVIMVVLGYFIPMLVALGATDAEQHEWVDGYFADVAKDIGGQWLSDWIVFAAGIANIALFQAELSADSFQLMGMADRGLVPSIFSIRSKHGTPTYGVILGTAIIVALSASNLDKLIEMLNFNYAICLLMEYAAFIKLRIAKPNVPRPFRIPLGTFGCCILLFPTIFLTLVVMSLASLPTYWFSLCSILVGFLIYYFYQGGKETTTTYDNVNISDDAEDHQVRMNNDKEEDVVNCNNEQQDPDLGNENISDIVIT